MLDPLCIPLLPSGLVANTSAILGVITLAMCLSFCWHQWKMVRAYSKFPSKRLDVEWLLPFIFRRYPKDVPFTNAFLLDLEINNERLKSFGENFMKTVDSAEERMVEKIGSPGYYWNFLLNLSPWGKYYLKTVDDANRLVREIMDEMMKKNAVSEKEQPNDDSSRVVHSCVDILRKLWLQDSYFTDQDVRDHLVNFVSAGYDTIATSMLWCLYALGHHPEVQEKAFQEVQALVPEGDVKFEHLAEMKYLDCVIKESHRLHPPAPVYGRKASKDIQCGKYTIPKGAEVVFFIFTLHRDPNNFPEPERFDPGRFSDGSKLRPWTHIPFAEGYRSCTGKNFALLEMKVQLAQILRRFRITSLNRISESELDYRVVLKPIKPVRLLFEKRH